MFAKCKIYSNASCIVKIYNSIIPIQLGFLRVDRNKWFPIRKLCNDLPHIKRCKRCTIVFRKVKKYWYREKQTATSIVPVSSGLNDKKDFSTNIEEKKSTILTNSILGKDTHFKQIVSRILQKNVSWESKTYARLSSYPRMSQKKKKN